jgi:Icc protein
MTRIAWMTDIHLNFLGTAQIEAWLYNLMQRRFDGIIIAGDIGEAPSVRDYLMRMNDRLQIPIYYVLGNHDYYQGSIEGVHTQMHKLVQKVPHLHWLNAQTKPIALSEDIAIVGHEGWGDGRYGSFFESPLMLNDYVLIQDLKTPSSQERLERLQALGDKGAEHLRKLIPLALEQYQTVYVVMHAPPYQETCFYKGVSASDDNPYLPHFTCKAHGDVLLEMAEHYPDKQINVLCGHTHGGCDVAIRPNLRVQCGEVEYGKPVVQGVLELS